MIFQGGGVIVLSWTSHLSGWCVNKDIFAWESIRTSTLSPILDSTALATSPCIVLTSRALHSSSVTALTVLVLMGFADSLRIQWQSPPPNLSPQGPSHRPFSTVRQINPIDKVVPFVSLVEGNCMYHGCWISG